MVRRKLLYQYYTAMGFFKLTRVPNLIIIGLTQYVTAIFLVNHKTEWLNVITDLKFFLLVISTTMIAAAGYIINDYYDTKIDYVNRPREVIVGRVIGRRYVLATYFVLNGLALLIGVFISIQIALIHFASILMLWLHSNQLKRWLLFGNFVIGALAGLSLLIVAVYFGEMGKLVFAYSFFAFVINMIREILKDLAAIKGEEKFGSHALPSVFGMRRTKMFIYLLVAASVIALSTFLINVDNRVALAYFLILIPVFTYFMVLLVRADTQKKFAFLSNFANLIMLSGIISITLF